MTRKTPRPLWRAIVLDENGHAMSFLLHADDADDAADQAEHQTGMECVIVDDITPAPRRAAAYAQAVMSGEAA